jgi:hypothetical protein
MQSHQMKGPKHEASLAFRRKLGWSSAVQIGHDPGNGRLKKAGQLYVFQFNAQQESMVTFWDNREGDHD